MGRLLDLKVHSSRINSTCPCYCSRRSRGIWGISKCSATRPGHLLQAHIHPW